MKTKLSILILMVMATGLLMTRCSKDNVETNLNNKPEVPEAFQLKVGNDIRQFLTKVETFKQNPLLKNDETIETDSALWYLESCFNYSYGFPNQFYTSFKIDTLDFTLALAGNRRVSMTALSAKYEQMIDEVRQVYHASSFEQKGIALISLQRASTSAESISFTVNVVTGEKTDNIPPQPVIEGPFVDEDYWWYGENKGRCGENEWDSDAAQQLMMAMNACLPDPTGNFYVINPIFKERIGGKLNVRRPNDPLDNNFDYYLFYASEAVGVVDLCLERNTMNTYFAHLRYLGLEKIKEDEGLGSMYSLIGITNLIGDKYETFISANPILNYFHQGTFHYGIRIYYIDGGEASEL